MITALYALLEGEHFFADYGPFELTVVKETTEHCEQM